MKTFSLRVTKKHLNKAIKETQRFDSDCTRVCLIAQAGRDKFKSKLVTMGYTEMLIPKFGRFVCDECNDFTVDFDSGKYEELRGKLPRTFEFKLKQNYQFTLQQMQKSGWVGTWENENKIIVEKQMWFRSGRRIVEGEISKKDGKFKFKNEN